MMFSAIGALNSRRLYRLKNPDNPYIMVYDRPKSDVLKKQFPELFDTYKGQR
jgi:peptide-methionine (S)-S-oxide reductase